MFIYNLSLLVIFWTLKQFISFSNKTLFSFSDLKVNYFFSTTIAVALFSIAGVPPFLGFFSKLFILLSLLNANFFFFFFFFFGLLFFGLYFYLQNIRFLYTSGSGKIAYTFENGLRLSSFFVFFTHFILFSLVFGFFFIDDLTLLFYWIFA